MKLVNLTPHPLNFYHAGAVYRQGKRLWLMDNMATPYFILDTPMPPRPVRVQYERRYVEAIDGIPFFRNEVSNILNLPAPQPDTLYVVSQTAAEALWAIGRTHDVVCPLDRIYASETRVVGCTGLRYADEGLV